MSGRPVCYGAAEHARRINGVVEHGGFLEVAAFEFGQAAELFVIAECLQGREYRQHGRCVEHRSFLDVGAVVEHCGYGAIHMSEGIFADDDKGYTCRSEILLCAGIDGVVA